MEFYIKLLQMLVKPRHALFNILGGKKEMLVGQVKLKSSIMHLSWFSYLEH
jgi:hypothetical protein